MQATYCFLSDPLAFVIAFAGLDRAKCVRDLCVIITCCGALQCAIEESDISAIIGRNELRHVLAGFEIIPSRLVTHYVVV